MFSNINFFNNKLILTQTLNIQLLTVVIFFLNFFFFFKTKNILKKIISTLLNLFLITVFIVYKSNEAFAYLFFLTEITAILVFVPILLSKPSVFLDKKNLNFNYYWIIFLIITVISFFFFNINEKYTIFLDKIYYKNDITNDLYSLFLIINYNHSLQIFFLLVFLVLNMIIIFSVLKEKNLKTKYIKFDIYKKYVKNLYKDFYKKYYENHKNIFSKFKNWKK